MDENASTLDDTEAVPDFVSSDAITLIELEEVLNTVLNSTESSVTAISGRWGEGKTFFWKKYASSANLVKRPGYLSVFGAASLREIRERVAFEALKSNSWIKSSWATCIENLWSSFLPHTWIMQPFLRWAGGVLSKIVVRWPQYLSLILKPSSLSVQVMEDGLIEEGWVLCIDDIERKSADVAIGDVLGYIAELRDQRGVKVVLIFSQDKLEKGAEGFLEYREKVIDRILPFRPNTGDIVDLAFDGSAIFASNEEIRDDLITKCDCLELRNIRVLMKVRHYLGELEKALPSDVKIEFLRDRVASLLLFVWCYQTNDAPSWFRSENLIEYGGYSLAALDDAEEDSEDSKAVELLREFGYSHTDEIDKLLINFVRREVLNKSALLKEYKVWADSGEERELSENLTQVWRKYYHGSLSDNAEEFTRELIPATRKCLPHIEFHNLGGALRVLSDLGLDEDAESLFEEFKQVRHDLVDNDDLFWGTFPIEYEPLAKYLQDIRDKNELDLRGIESVLDSIQSSEFAMSKDRERLSQFTSDEVVEYLLTHDRAHITGLLKELKNSGIATYPDIAAKLAAANPLNAIRLKGMKLLEPDATND